MGLGGGWLYRIANNPHGEQASKVENMKNNLEKKFNGPEIRAGATKRDLSVHLGLDVGFEEETDSIEAEIPHPHNFIPRYTAWYASAPTKIPKRCRCCNEHVGDSAGCTTMVHHVYKVNDPKTLASILNYVETPDDQDIAIIQGSPEDFDDILCPLASQSALGLSRI
ncbi:unnamed protein product [Clonostachys solani]|uniref:Uncharacterized protein n=1 Tax=Clonostachys solani TaxID=160281 RepID=A0A9P0ECF8_9HYPO|nr:unnamed protein product [Clonostachys solani]